MLKKLLTLEISLDDVLRFVKGTISDVHIYKALIENSQKKSKNARILRKNNVETFKNFNKLFLKGVIRFEKEKLPIRDIIKMIRDAGGYAVLAHAFWKKSTTIHNVQEKVEYLQGIGLNGLEVFYFRHSQTQTLKLHQITQELSTNENPMYETKGSDFHSFDRVGELRRIGYIHTYGLKPNFFPLG
jgi:predicted metal-dependent phosphoesterase TrpH